MTSSPIDDIKARLDIVEVISSYIKLQKAGANYRAVCPFHSEKSPSFFVSPARQIWHCFGCNSGGDVFGFVKQIEGIEFGDALKILAQKAGVELKPFRPEFKELATERTRLYEATELATSFFEKQLEASAAGKKAKDYLLGRGISEDSIKKWRLGYSPDTWQGLIDFLSGRGFKNAEVEKAGLAIKKDSGGHYDRFRGRIMFPIFDLNSQIIGFGGRVVGRPGAEVVEIETGTRVQAIKGSGQKGRVSTEDNIGIGTAKYINTPSTILYDKSRTLYGLDKAKVEVRKKDTCILVEGYTDVILSSQSGIENVAAVSGIALTPLQLKILRRYTENLLISFDMDLAGDSATKRGINLALNQGFNIKVVTLPEGKDAADLILKSIKSWEESIEKAKSILEFYFETTLKKLDKKEIEGKKEISKILLPIIKRIPNKIEQTFWLQRLSNEIQVKEEDLIIELAKTKSEEEVLGLEPEETINLPLKTRKELLEERLLILVLSDRQNLEKVTAEDLEMLPSNISQIIRVYQQAKDSETAFKKLKSEEKKTVDYLLLKAEMLQELSKKDQDIDFLDCLREIKNMQIKADLELLSQDLRAAEFKKDAKVITTLVEKFNQLVKKLSKD
ncbi:CHC2 zinc finger domain-containing protein [Candidatus Parcubacteria bacterium]|nr:toprim domain-containing protein [Patescibacteria group bacterium]MBU4350883.1 toprim domain-containing protein [Patescibacteria group bacterium]MCG2688665.1 CHC2 zinc finger domain-containing protein [Candidatus Parcubacteria bacterium]